jgi:hypothetical protein
MMGSMEKSRTSNKKHQEDGVEGLVQDTETAPATANVLPDDFLSYAVQYWAVHYRRASTAMDETCRFKLNRIFKSSELTKFWAE